MYQSADLLTLVTQERITSPGIGAFAQVARGEVAATCEASGKLAISFLPT